MKRTSSRYFEKTITRVGLILFASFIILELAYAIKVIYLIATRSGNWVGALESFGTMTLMSILPFVAIFLCGYLATKSKKHSEKRYNGILFMIGLTPLYYTIASIFAPFAAQTGGNSIILEIILRNYPTYLFILVGVTLAVWYSRRKKQTPLVSFVPFQWLAIIPGALFPIYALILAYSSISYLSVYAIALLVLLVAAMIAFSIGTYILTKKFHTRATWRMRATYAGIGIGMGWFGIIMSIGIGNVFSIWDDSSTLSMTCNLLLMTLYFVIIRQATRKSK